MMVVIYCYLDKNKRESFETSQTRKQRFFRTGRVSWNEDILMKILPKTHQRITTQGKILDFFLLDILKDALSSLRQTFVIQTTF